MDTFLKRIVNSILMDSIVVDKSYQYFFPKLAQIVPINYCYF